MTRAEALRRLRAAVRPLGGSVEDNPSRRHFDCNIDAPRGKVWNATDAHTIVVATAKGPPEWIADAVAAGLEDIAAGLRPCDVPDCDYCGEDHVDVARGARLE